MASLRFKDQIAGHDHAHRKPRPDRECWRNITLTTHDLAACITDGILCAVADGSGDGIVSISPQFGTDVEHCRKKRRPQYTAPMVIDTVLESCIACAIRSGLSFQDNGLAIGQDGPGPDKQDAVLAETDAIVIFADEAGSLRQQEIALRGAVIDVLGHLSHDLAGEVRANASDEGGGNDGPCLRDVRRGGWCDPVGREDASVDGGIEEIESAVLVRLCTTAGLWCDEATWSCETWCSEARWNGR